jgi:hypothetical protein
VTLIKLLTNEEAYMVKEAYTTIKARLAKIDPFIEVTFGDRKLILNKSIIGEVVSEPAKTAEIKEKEVKKENKK